MRAALLRVIGGKPRFQVFTGKGQLSTREQGHADPLGASRGGPVPGGPLPLPTTLPPHDVQAFFHRQRRDVQQSADPGAIHGAIPGPRR